MGKIFVLLPVLLIAVSSRPQEETQCASGESAPVYNFKPDCKNASDEDLWGLCDFEQHSCGWKNVSQESYSWRRELANITSVPGVDHTTGNASGHVMHAGGEPTFMSSAILEYSVDKPAALGCQISFWYYIYENTTSPSSSTFEITMLRGGERKVLLELRKGNTDGWETASARIGNQPAGYKLRLSFSPPFFEKPDAMLDDISLDYCAEGDVPAGSDQLSCDFEEDICSWYHDYAASLLWERERNFKEGYYMEITASPWLNISSAARLVGYLQPAAQVTCVNFWYRIFGNSIGSLKFITKAPGEAETVVWIRSGTQGNKWRFADLAFNSDKPIQFILEAVTGGDQGSIAIDNIEVYRSETDSCPAERECTFQGSLCGLQPQPSANFTWARLSGESKPADSSGPTADHTLGTDQGFYLSGQLWKRPAASRVAIQTAVMEPTESDGECLMFWYHMEGSGVGELSVYLQTLDESVLPARWTRSGDQGKYWRHGRVTLSSSVPYQVIFEAVVGNEPGRDIAIDDLTILDGSCPPSGFCDFEMDFCGWVNSAPAETGVEWDWLSGESGGALVPRRDHTTNSPLGHFAFYVSEKKELARLESETMEAVDRACLEMWHIVQAWGGSGNSSITLTVFMNESAGLRRVWERKGDRSGSWIRDRVDYNASGPHQIVLQASDPDLEEESLSLDDIHIIRGRFCNDITPTTTPNPPTSTTSAPPASAMDCTFENGLCSWAQEINDDLDWTLSSGFNMSQPWDGPQYDHTVGNNQGFFLLLNGPGSKDGETASVSVPVDILSSEICVRFWYHMSGPSVSSLDLLVKTESSEDLIWTRRGIQNPQWINAQVNISLSGMQKLMLTGYRNTTSKGFIAIDDITVNEGTCGDQTVCGFDSSDCGFISSITHEGRWVRTKAVKNEVDHTYGTENGFYMTTDATQTAQLLTPHLSSDTELCVRFWYWLPEGPSNILSVHVMRSWDVGDALWSRSGAPSLGWEVAEVTVSSPAQFQVVFQAVHESRAASAIKLDDISMTEGTCGPPVSCDFGSGQCSWVNLPTAGGHDWVLADGGFQGPVTDHTTQTPEGQFLLSSSLHQNDISLARVSSEWIHLGKDPYCLTLWYQMDGSASGSLKVFRNTGTEEQELLFHTSSSELGWTRFSEPVQMDKPFQLLIVAEANNRGFIAVDDITITPGSCQVNETSPALVGCTFENGTCGWEDISVGQCQWTRERNSFDIGPPSDHTVGTEAGWYMALKLNERDQMSPAALQSPTMRNASAICTLHFYYYLNGEDNADLNVVLRVGPRTTTLWWLSGNHAEKWHHGEVTVGRVPVDFNILFEASRSFIKPGHVAIDDVFFTNCTSPEPQPSCPENMFECNNRVCVEPSRVCDFSDDCGDGSDENSCEAQGFVERCSFEQGLCSWARSDVDTPDAEWSRHRGGDAWPGQGPHRDHTQNSAAGHFVIPGMHLTEKGQTSEMLSKTLLASSSCTVRFFFWSLNDAAATLTAQSRTLQSGINDDVLWLKKKSTSYSWQRAEVTFSTSAHSKLVFRYERGDGVGGLVALDDISFSKECVFDPDNSKLPNTSTTSAPPTPSHTPTPPATPSTAPTNPCQDNEFFCWQSADKVCIQAALQCDYHADCPHGEDEDGCGQCTFESNQCQWTDTSHGQPRWLRHKASNDTDPPTDHTTETGYYMRVNFNQRSPQHEARLQSPSLRPSSQYCQILFHFHISAESAGSLRVLMQQADGSVAILWSRSHNTVSHWSPELLPVGQHQRPYKVWFSSINQVTGTDTNGHTVAVDDISFLNCEKTYTPPAPSSCGCSFEDGLCVWVQGAEGRSEWLSQSGPTETPNTGPGGDHTTGKGKYLYIKSSAPSTKGDMAQLKSPMLPPAGEMGYCLTFWYHMFGATVGSLRMLLQTTDPMKKTMVWQESGNQGDEWQRVQIYVTLQGVHQVIVEATVGGEAGDIAIDDISLFSGPCPTSDMCDFEDGSCNWQQQTDDDLDWVRQSGSSLTPNTGPDSDHTTNTPTGHYFYLPSSLADRAGQTAKLSSALYPAGKGACVQLWYHMYGKGVGTLNVYQQGEDGKQALIFSQAGDQGRLWRFAQAELLPRVQPYRIMVEGVKSGPTVEGDMAFDDVLLLDAECPSTAHCDFEVNMCSWSNVGGRVDQKNWLRGRGNSQNPNTGPSFDHTTNTAYGYYLYVDTSVGELGDTSFLVSDVFQPSTRGHCLTFWYHMYGHNVGTLRVHINDRKMHSSDNEDGTLKWIESGDKGAEWQKASLDITHEEAFWFVFVYERGMNAGGDIALDDITVSREGCYNEPIRPPGNNNATLSVGLAVGLTLLAGIILCISFFLLKRRSKLSILDNGDADGQSSVFDLHNCKIDDTQHITESGFSFNSLHEDDTAMDSSDT